MAAEGYKAIKARYPRERVKKMQARLIHRGKPKEFNDFHFRVLVDFYNMKGGNASSHDL